MRPYQPTAKTVALQSRLATHRKHRRNDGLRLLPHGYSICLVFLKLFERIYAPLTAALLSHLAPIPSWTTPAAANLVASTGWLTKDPQSF